MELHPHVVVVIAAYNESAQIAEVVRGVMGAGYRRVVVVDDGSVDQTSDRAVAAGAVVLRHIINRGQGAALKTGIDHALASGADIVVTFDADGQHDPSDLDAIVAPVRDGTVEASLGSRFLRPGSNVPYVRKLALKGGAFLMRVMYGVQLTDSHNGFRALSRSALGRMELRADKMEHASEIISEIGRKHIRYCEVPVTIRYTEYSIRNSKQGPMPALRIAWKMLMHKVMR